jgi:hypothetical protein
MIHFTCANCKRDFSVDNSLAGKSGKCSWCGAPVTIPEPYADGTRTDEARDPNLDEAVTAVPPSEGGYPDIRRPSEFAGEEVDIRLPADTDLTQVDWLVCIFCSGIGCIVGIIRLIQGRPNAGKMIGVSLLFSALWTFLRFVLLSLRGPGF